MSDQDDPETETNDAPRKTSKLPLLIGLVLGMAGGGAGFYATWSGMILAPESDSHADTENDVIGDTPDIAFVAVDPLTISLAGSDNAQYLRFRAELEVPSAHQSHVELLLPRVVDVLNGYLRALEVADLEDPSALIRLRAQMLRRVQVVAGPGRVNDLLVMEFVLN
ncbi:flagellar basal body-associated FliL family protein [Sulfitobacter sabulilitoris]|uniref:Flagellar protein FliL n=1 Tax=Sulfitobacter sabulilitoris TaxID=2562655 RepID=A0A5S3PEL8_9RHOB|nr:flagellar basal body-associated FliL family protein [Sulfitobacter sabulilitoris]TMM52494.1 flagellar basal body protein FliL [Sulfitobacter sabulilitoris]